MFNKKCLVFRYSVIVRQNLFGETRTTHANMVLTPWILPQVAEHSNFGDKNHQSSRLSLPFDDGQWF